MPNKVDIVLKQFIEEISKLLGNRLKKVIWFRYNDINRFNRRRTNKI